MQARDNFGLAELDSTLYAVGGGTNNGFSAVLGSAEFLAVYAACNATTPTQPPPPGTSPSSQLSVYRMQGATWVANVSNADAADVGGLSCFIERNAAEWLPKYGDHPVVARYTVAAVAPDTRPVDHNTGYKDCTEQPPRTCAASRGNPLQVGVEATNTTDCSYAGSWYSLPSAGECRAGCRQDHPSSPCLGFSCYWQVTAITKIVSWDCLQSHGCSAKLGGCPPATLEAAFDACTDLCTPPVPSDGCASVPSSAISNELDRYAFDPVQCTACLQKGTQAWYAAVAAPTQWACGQPDPTKDMTSMISFEPGTVSNVSDACRCHYTDLAPQPLPCPHGSYAACVVACAELPPAKIATCDAECKRLCPH